MRLIDVVIGDEYAVHPSMTLQSGSTAPPEAAYRARAVAPAARERSHYGRSAPQRVTFEITALPLGGNWIGVRKVGDRFDLTGPYVWRKWSDHEPLLASSIALRERRGALRADVSTALGVLGLHDQRDVHIFRTPIGSGRDLPELADVEATLSGAELLKLANRAEHLVELERLVREWTSEQLRNRDCDNIADWRDAHDFSMLDAPPESAPTAAEIEAELAAAHPDPDA